MVRPKSADSTGLKIQYQPVNNRRQRNQKAKERSPVESCFILGALSQGEHHKAYGKKN